MLSSVTARWIRTEISARLAAMTFLKGGGGSLSDVICCGLMMAESSDLVSTSVATNSRELSTTAVCLMVWSGEDDGMKAEVIPAAATRATRATGWMSAMIVKVSISSAL